MFSHRSFFDFRWIWEPFWERKSFPNRRKIDSKTWTVFNIAFNRHFFDFGAQDGPKMAPKWRQDEPKMPPRCRFKSNITTGGSQDPFRPRFSLIFDPPGHCFSVFFIMVFDVILHSTLSVKSYKQLSEHFSFMYWCVSFLMIVVCMYFNFPMFFNFISHPPWPLWNRWRCKCHAGALWRHSDCALTPAGKDVELDQIERPDKKQF